MLRAPPPPETPISSDFEKSPLPDSNRRPLPYHGSALPTELRGHFAGSVPLQRPHGERVPCVADTETTHSGKVAARGSVAPRRSRRAREQRSDGLEARLGGTDRAGTGRERDHARSRAAMLGAGPRLGPGPLRALPVVITGLAAQHLRRRRSRGPGARDLDLGARKLLLEPRVGSLEVVTEVLVVVGGDRLARRAAALGHRGDALAGRQARADVPAPSGVRGGVRQVVARCVGLRGRLARGAQVLAAPALLLALGHVAAG